MKTLAHILKREFLVPGCGQVDPAVTSIPSSQKITKAVSKM